MIGIIIISILSSSMIIGLSGRYIGINYSRILVIISLILSSIVSIILYYNVMILSIDYRYKIMSWIKVENLNIDWSFIIDKVSISVLIPVIIISMLVHIYGIIYMEHDPHQQRFLSYLLFFTLGMIILVIGDNLLVLFLGWELIGVASYLLISFWYTRINASKSGLNALLVNRFGDTFLVLGLGLIIYSIGSINYDTLFSVNNIISTDILTIILICILIGCSSKSVQFGLHSWLLNSMEGPTPVSSLLHAACLVIAGVYLLIRCSYIVEYSPIILICILILGGITTLIAGLIAIVSNDIKKIIALSTMSQIGIMMVGIGISGYNLALFHLFCHSFFKALLFMSAGSIIHSVMSEYQDIRMYGGFKNYLPLTYSSMLIGSLSLMAIPGLTGYYSKDIIIESLYGDYSITGYIIYWFSLSSAVLTSIYSIRLIYYIFLINPNNTKYIYNNLKENSIYMYIPMIILAILSIFIGYLIKDIYLGLGSLIYNNIYIHPNNLNIVETEFSLNWIIKLLPLILSIILISILLILYEYNYSKLIIMNNMILKKVYNFFNLKLNFDQIFNNIILRISLYVSSILNESLDKGFLINILGPKGFYNVTIISSNNINNLVYINLSLMLELIFISIILSVLFINYNNIFIYIILLFIYIFV